MIILVCRAISQFKRSESMSRLITSSARALLWVSRAVMASPCIFFTMTNIRFMVLSNGISAGLRRSFIIMSVSVSSATSWPIVIWVKSRTTLLTNGGNRCFDVSRIAVNPVIYAPIRIRNRNDGSVI